MTTLEAQHEVITNLILENKKLKQECDEARNKMADALQEVDLRTLDFERMNQECYELRKDVRKLQEIKQKHEQQEADAIEKECEEYELTKDKMIFYYEVDQKMTEEDWNSFGEYHNKPESKEKKDVKPNTLEIYPPASEKKKPVYFLEIYNKERWKLCLRNYIDDFSIPKFGWSSAGHPYTLGEGKIASEGLINMYTLSNLKRIVDGLNLLDNKDRSSIPSTTIETSKEKVNWQKDFPHSITTSP